MNDAVWNVIGEIQNNRADMTQRNINEMTDKILAEEAEDKNGNIFARTMCEYCSYATICRTKL